MTGQLDLFALAADATINRPRLARREQDVHPHSFDAHDDITPLAKRAGQVLHYLKQQGRHTDREVMAGLGFSDMNAVRPRITELIDAGLVQEVGAVRDAVTGKIVRVVAVA